MARAEFSKQVRRDAFLRARGKCELCGCKFKYGECEFHHRIEAYLGGEATLANAVCLCRHCHALATKARHPEIDKTRRLSDRRMNIRKKPTMPGSRQSKFKKTIRGAVINRHTGEPI